MLKRNREQNKFIKKEKEIMLKKIYYLYGWIFVRPRRKLFKKMICNSYLRIIPEKHCGKWLLPNLLWWLLYISVFKFSKYSYWRTWSYLCTYGNGRLKRKPILWIIARIIHGISSTTAGCAINIGECFHCSHPDGWSAELSEDETGVNFILEKSWTVGTMDGTDYRFCGITICPICGYRDYYEDGSL